MNVIKTVPAIALCALLLAGCAHDAPDGSASSSAPDHLHAAPAEPNVIEHERVGYCGNTVTALRCRVGGDRWERSFWGGDSVTMTDLLRFLDYSGEVCRCAPEYTVDTEFGKGYDLNLTQGFARHDGGQTDLTPEQLETLRSIIDRAAEQPPVCKLPLADEGVSMIE